MCNVIQRIMAVQGQFGSTTIVDFGINRKHVCGLLINSNLGPILHRLGDTVA